MHRSFSVALTMALALALLVSACGGEEEVASTDTTARDTAARDTAARDTTARDTAAPDSVELTLAMDAAGPDEIDEAAEVVRRRLESLGITGSSVEASADGIDVRVPVEDEELVRESLQIPGVLEFRPVLATVGTVDDGGQLTPPPERVPDAAVTLADEDGVVYRLGPVALDGRALEGASAAQSNGMWTVSPVFRPGEDGIDRFNAIASACYDGQPICPGSDGTGALQGQLALVLDGVVLTAPSIHTPQFERDQISISGAFDETSARALAAVLDAGGAPAAWSLPD